MKLVFTCCILLSCLNIFAQVRMPYALDTTAKSVAYWEGWLQDLNTRGARYQSDSFVVEPEVIKLMKDESYRQSVYPATYNWEATVSLMQNMELKKAFWHLLNLYAADKQNRQLVLHTFVTYDSVFAMDQMLMNSFYTYAFTDPRVYRNINGKADIFRPDLLEKNLATAKEICQYIWAYRKQKTANSKTK